jgi:prepilin-type N-terminal cleavage/methylation domain-containing protein
MKTVTRTTTASKTCRQGGFTLVEMMVALVTAIMLIGGVYLVYLMALRSWAEGSSNVALERTAGVLMDKIVRGVNGRFGLREADIGLITISADGHSVTFLADKNDPPTAWNSDDVTSRYYQLGTNIYYDPNSSVAGDEIRLNRFGNVENLAFSMSRYVVTARLSLTAPAPRITERLLSVRMETNIFLRKRR